jgi:hypothetical protein
MKLQTTRTFDRDYSHLPAAIIEAVNASKERVDKQLALLLNNPRHPSLGLKRIVGTESLWEVRITRGYRMTLQVADDTFILRRLGPHDVLRRP